MTAPLGFPSRYAALAVLGIAFPTVLLAQAGYYDLDAGRPTRVEDGVPLERHALALQLFPTNVERLDDGTLRVRVEPKLALGAFPLTEFEVRAPYVYTRAPGGAASASGLSGMGFGVLRALDLETRRAPALALFGELLVPAGGSSGAPLSYTLKGILTKTTPLGRVHLNVAGGTYALPAPKQTGDCSIDAEAGDCVSVPQLPDPPCDVAPLGTSSRAAAPALRAHCGAVAAASQPAVASGDTSRSGPRLFVGLGVDHALPLRSLLLSATTYVERFSGPYVSTDWSVELGLRHQLTPRTVIDGGVARRLSGVAPSTTVLLGLTHGLAIRSARTVPRGETP